MPLSIKIPELILEENAALCLREHLARLKVVNPLLITDRGLVKTGHVTRILEAFGPRRPPAGFDLTLENPTALCVDLATDFYLAEKCDAVIALGGGSVIDTAKLTAVTGTHGGSAIDYLGKSHLISNKTSPIIAIPTTAGTGSEASPGAGIHPTSTEASRGVNSPFLIPRLAICDPALTVTLPARLIAATALDALSHCIEGYLAAGENPIADVLALEGVKIIRERLPRAMEKNDLCSREQLMLAAFYGGVAIGKGLGAAHSIAISCGDRGIHHGVLSALGLVAILDDMEKLVPGRCQDIRSALGVGKAVTISEAIRDMLKAFGLPTSLGESGYEITDLNALAQSCAESHFNRTSRVQFLHADFSAMLLSVK